MKQRNSAVIDKSKSKEFALFMKRNAKNKAYWEANKQYLQTHKVDKTQLDSLFQ